MNVATTDAAAVTCPPAAGPAAAAASLRALQNATADRFGQPQHPSGGRADSDGPTVTVTQTRTAAAVFQAQIIKPSQLNLQVSYIKMSQYRATAAAAAA